MILKFFKFFFWNQMWVKNIFLSKYNFIFVVCLIIFHILFFPFKGYKEDLHKTSLRFIQNQWEEGRLRNIDKNQPFNLDQFLTLEEFNLRDNNLWINLLFYQKYEDNLKKFFDKQEVNEFPTPVYPVFSHILRLITGYHFFPPANIIEIASFLRKKVGSGILIRTKDQKIHSINGQYNREQLIEILKKNQENLLNLFQLKLFYYERNSNGLKYQTHSTSYLNFISSIQKTLKNSQDKEFHSAAISYNIEVSKKFNDLGKEFKHLKNLNEETNKSLLYSKYFIYKDAFLNNDTQNTIDFFKDLRKKIARVYTFQIKGTLQGQNYQKEWLIEMDNFPDYEKLFHLNHFPDLKINEINIYESKILKYKSNSRKYLSSSYISQKIRNAFMLLEDDYFYIEFGGVDVFALLKAAYGYVFHNEKKGYASISEQVYEMYLGKQKKTVLEKIQQIFGAIYIYYFTPKKDNILDLYIQSVPGSFWRDHNYGISGIIKNYLNKDSIDQLSLKEIAWISRIGLLPNLLGQQYIRYSLFKKVLDIQTSDILDDQKFNSLLKQLDKKKLDTSFLKSDVLKYRQVYKNIHKRMEIALKKFLNGNLIISPLLLENKFHEIIKKDIEFSPSEMINEYQSYTDQTLKEIQQYLGSWSSNIGLDIQVELDEKSQNLLDNELLKANELINRHKVEDDALDANIDHPLYGGSSILIKTNHIKTGDISNKIIAISSYHPNHKNEYFNWAVEGNRHFGSIFKWIILSLYLNQGGTLLDEFYDIPRRYKYISKHVRKVPIYDYYYPDNWKNSKESPFGYFSYKKENNLINFIKSKNNTFVRIAEIVGLKNLSRILNELAGLDTEVNSNLKFDPIYPIALGSQEITSIRFSQINTIISNRGIFQPITTIYGIRFYDDFLHFDLSKKYQKRVLSREAAEAALFCGYVSTFSGTATRFITGGVGKTGSSSTDLSFLGMTERTKDEWVKDDPNYILNHNLLYLVNFGVNRGSHILEGLYGGNTAIFNAKRVFELILKNFDINSPLKEKISGDFVKYFSDKFDYVPINFYLQGEPLKVPVLKGEIKKIYEHDYNIEELKEIQNNYFDYVESKILEKKNEMEKEFESKIEKNLQKTTNINNNIDAVETNLDLYQLNNFEKFYKKIDLFYEYKIDEIKRLEDIYAPMLKEKDGKKEKVIENDLSIIEMYEDKNKNKNEEKRIRFENLMRYFKERIRYKNDKYGNSNEQILDRDLFLGPKPNLDRRKDSIEKEIPYNVDNIEKDSIEKKIPYNVENIEKDSIEKKIPYNVENIEKDSVEKEIPYNVENIEKDSVEKEIPYNVENIEKDSVEKEIPYNVENIEKDSIEKEIPYNVENIEKDSIEKEIPYNVENIEKDSIEKEIPYNVENIEKDSIKKEISKEKDKPKNEKEELMNKLLIEKIKQAEKIEKR